MHAKHRKKVRCQISRVLEVETLEDRQALSVFGISPTEQLVPTSLAIPTGPSQSQVIALPRSFDASSVAITNAGGAPSLTPPPLGQGLDILEPAGSETGTPATSDAGPGEGTSELF